MNICDSSTVIFFQRGVKIIKTLIEKECCFFFCATGTSHMLNSCIGAMLELLSYSFTSWTVSLPWLFSKLEMICRILPEEPRLFLMAEFHLIMTYRNLCCLSLKAVFVFANRQAEGSSLIDVQLSTHCQTNVKKSSGTAPCYCVWEVEKSLRQAWAEQFWYIRSVDRQLLFVGVCSISAVVPYLFHVNGDLHIAALHAFCTASSTSHPSSITSRCWRFVPLEDYCKNEHLKNKIISSAFIAHLASFFLFFKHKAIEGEMFVFYSAKPPCQYLINNPLLAVDICVRNAKTRFSAAESRLFCHDNHSDKVS